MPDGASAIAIRPAEAEDASAIWAILEPVIRAGETLALDRRMDRENALWAWMGGDRAAFVAEIDGEVVGVGYVRPNQGGGGAHVANAGYAVAESARGKGVARTLCRASLSAARAAGFRAMQFNLVVASNAAAVAAWTAEGFAEVGRLPGAFEHPRLGTVDALVMYRGL